MRPGPEGWWIPSLTASRLSRTRSDFVTSRVVLATGGGTGIGALPVVADVSEAPDVTHVVDADAGMALILRRTAPRIASKVGCRSRSMCA